jgi:HK97 family phage prohead protease
VNVTKSLSRIEVKDAEKGEITGVFSTLGVVDSDMDVTLKGAFENGAKVRISAYGHKSWEGALPVGKATIKEVGNEAIFDGRIFLDTQAGRDTFTVIKELGEDGLQEFSYGYDPIEYSFGEHEGQPVRFLTKVKVHEVSPVLLGAGVGTRLLTAKSGMKFSDHVEAVLADLDALLERATDVVALRAEKGKAISEDSAARLTAIKSRLEELVARTPIPPADDWSAALDLLAASASLRGATTT